MDIRESSTVDEPAVFDLYKRVASVPGGLARLENEVVPEYVSAFLRKAQTRGLSLVASVDRQLAGEIHAYPSDLFCFAHVWSELTIAVHPGYQGQGVGRRLFEAFMAHVGQRKEVLRVELIARESNSKAIAFYETLGFQQEGRFEGRIRNLDGSLEADIPMAWTRKHG